MKKGKSQLMYMGAAGLYKAGKYAYNKYNKASKTKAPARVFSNQGTVRKARRTRRAIAKKPVIKQIKNDIRELKRKSEVDKGRLTYRQRATGRVLSSVNAQNYSSLSAFSTAFYEGVLAQLRYYDPAAPASLVTADGTTGTYMKDFQFEKSYLKLSLRNNYQSPCIVSVYMCRPKEDTDITPTQAFTQGLTDVGNPTNTSPLVYITDSPQFTDLWRIEKSAKRQLQPGETLDLSVNNKSFSYDPSLVDSHALLFQSRFQCMGIAIRVDGVLGHDTAVDEQGVLAAGVDWVLDRTAIVEYSAGADIEFIYVTDGSDTFTNGGVVSQKPIPDNLGYSVA